MNFFSAVAADLVEKRLWPVAAVLGAGAVAAPVAAHLTAPQPASSAAPPAAAAPRTKPAPVDPAAVKSLIAELSPNYGAIILGTGGFHDPFTAASASSSTTPTAAPGTAPGGPAPASSSPVRGGSAPSTDGSTAGGGINVTPVSIKPPAKLKTVVSPPSGPSTGRTTPPAHATPPTTPSSGSSPSSGTTPGTTPSSGSTPSSGTSPSSSGPSHSGSPSSTWVPARPHSNAPSRRRGGHDSLWVYSATVRFGQAASAVTYRNPVRLSPLPSKADPEVVYLGVMKGGQRVAFLVPKSATATGDGTCQPDPTHCQVVALRPGGTEFLDILTPTGLIQYELDVVSISRHRSSTQSQAASLHRQESKTGRAILAKADASVLTSMAFSPTEGTVYARSSSPLAHPGSTVSTTREQPASPKPAPRPPAPASPPAPPSPPARPPAPAVAPTPGTPAPASGSTPGRSA